MKYFFTLIFTVFCMLFSNAQLVTEYSFSSATGGTLDAMTGSTQLIGSNQDDAASAVTPIGFTFSFAGTAYTQFSASSNGLIRLGAVAVSTQSSNTLSNVASTLPCIMPYWDNLTTGTNGQVHYVLSGTAPNRILKIEWFVTIPLNVTNPASATFQCWLYEATREVKFLFGTGMVINTGGYSMGIATSSSVYNMVRVATNVNSTTLFDMSTSEAISFGKSYSFVAPPICTSTPPSGFAACSVSNACTSKPFNLLLIGVILLSSNSYQWQSSPAGANTFTNLGASQPAWTYTVPSQTAATDYRVITTCTISGLSNTSSIVSVGQNTFINCYCIPVIGFKDPDDIITNVSIGTLNNSSTYAAPSYYSLYNNTPVNLPRLTSHNISITNGVGSGNYTAVWIDYNQNGLFDASENVAFATTPTVANATVNYSFAVPATAILGQTRMRVRLGTQLAFAASNACTQWGYGETEDYLVNIAAAPSCLPLLGLTNTIINATSVSHSWLLQGVAPAQGYEYAFTTSATPPASGTVSAVASVVTNGLIAGNTYYLHARGNCGAGDYSMWVTSAPIRLIHCTPAPTSVDGLGITNVSFGTINNTTVAEPNNYGNYSSQISVHQRGSIVPVSITYKTGYTYDTKIYIDYNDDYDFNDVGEEVYSGVSLATNPTTLLASITIPVSAPLGRHRLRIGGLDDGPVSPCYTDSYGSFEDYTIEIETATICTGTPANVAIAGTSILGCTVLNTLLTATTTSQGSGKTYQWQSSITGANNFTNISGATSSTYAVSTTISRDYKVIITCSGNSATSAAFPVTVLYPAVNDNICDAIPLTLNAPSVCGNTFCATVLNTDPNSTNSVPNNTVWYTFTPTTTAAYVVTLSRPAAATTDLLNGYLSLYTATGTCPVGIFLTQVPTNLSFNLEVDSLVEVATPSLTAGTKYYFMIDGSSGVDSGIFCIRINPIPLPPLCTTNISPANNATNVPLIPYITLTWNAVPGASSYNVYYDEVNPPAYLDVSGSNFIEIVGSMHSSPYYWYVVPKNVGGAAIGCATNISMFTSSSVCEPYYGVSCNFGINLEDVVLKGEGASAINVIGTVCEQINQFTDLTASTTVNLAVGKAYTGSFKTNNAKGYVSIWIDFNNNNIFETTEMLLNNLLAKAVGATTDYSILIPTTATTGVRKMRVREVFYNTAPTLPSDPCNPYNYGEAKDFSVNIVATGAAYTVSNVGAGACVEVAKATIDSASNNNTINVPLLDVTGALVASINANGNNLKSITTSVYRNIGAVRQDASGKKYLDRNISITPAVQPTIGNVAVRLYFTAAELAALQAADPSVTNASSLNVTKTSAECAAVYAPASSTFLSQSSNGVQGTNYFINMNTPSFSSFFIAGVNAVLPISIEYIKGIKNERAHQVNWKINCTATPFVKMMLERSSDGNRFNDIYEETVTAIRCLQPFMYEDLHPLKNRNYYRIKTIDIDGKILYSSIITLLNNDAGFELITVTPNPVKDNVILNLSSTKAGKIFLQISEISGRILFTKAMLVIAGNNNIGLNTENLSAGSYIISVKNDNGVKRNIKFVKY